MSVRQDLPPALAPFVPSASDPWDLAKAAHLARRAGFGVDAAGAAELVAAGPAAAVARFVDFPDEDEGLEAELRALGGALVDFGVERGAGPLDPLRRWWLYRLVRGAHPLQEKLCLLWHDHFACQESKVVRLPLLLEQNRTFRRFAAAPFRALLGAVARDPAMLRYLDNRLSTKEAPNENWARELLELFALGVDRYSQRDVVELARVFTGWTSPDANEPAFAFDPALHDEGDKLVFDERLPGRAGPDGVLEGEQALDRVVARPDCARFLAGKLLGWFAEHEPEEPIVAAVAEVLHASGLDVRAALRALFASRWFHAPERRFALVRNPVHYVVAAARGLGVQNPDRAGLEQATARMGMRLLEPPSVAGWEHGAAWTGAGTAAARLDVALALAELPHAARRTVGRATIDVDALGAPEADHGAAGGCDAAAVVDGVLARLWPEATRGGPAPLDGARRGALEEVARGAFERAPDDLDARRRRRRATRAVLHLTLTLPELGLE